MRKAISNGLSAAIVATLDKNLASHTVPDFTAAVTKALEG